MGSCYEEGSCLIALLKSLLIEVVEVPGGDGAHARIYLGLQLYGTGSDLAPVTLSFVDVNGNHRSAMILHVHYKRWFGFSDSEQELVYLNEHGSFRPARPDELPALQRYLQQHGQ